MRKQNNIPYLEHILVAISDIKRFAIAPMDEDAREAAIERKLEIIGEAVKKLSKNLRDANPDIPWNKIAGLRDRLIHDYMGIDVEIIKAVVDRYLPPLEKTTAEILQKLRGKS
jgi:uncharacterized protein with HEPN domain